jgi:hypothetical protein
MTSMSSRRRSSAQIGKRTCVAAHRRHRARRGRSIRDGRARSSRGLAQPQGTSRPPQHGQRSAPELRSCSTSSGWSSTASTALSVASQSHLVSVAPVAGGREGQLVLRSSRARRRRASRVHGRVLTLDDATSPARPHPTWRSTAGSETPHRSAGSPRRSAGSSGCREHQRCSFARASRSEDPAFGGLGA